MPTLRLVYPADRTSHKLVNLRTDHLADATAYSSCTKQILNWLKVRSIVPLS